MFAKSGCREKCSVRCMKEQGVSLRLTHNTSTPQPSHNRILSGRVLSRMSGPFPWMTYLLFWCWLIGAVIPSGRVWGAVSNQPGDNWSHHDSSNALSTGQGHPIKPISQTLWMSHDTLIFVGIVAYRDPRCATTLSYLLSRAKYPDRIRIGVVQQRHTEEDHFHCLRDYCSHASHGNGSPCPHERQLQMIEFTHQMARGPGYARHLVETLVKNEDFFLYLDAHSEVVEHWDEKLLHQWSLTENEFAILSSVPVDNGVLFDEAFQNRREVPHTCQLHFDKGYPVALPPMSARSLTRPSLSVALHGGFALMRMHAVRKVPHDPLQQLVYEHDDIAHFARLWTHGYDVYTPTVALVGHDYLAQMPVFSSGHPGQQQGVGNLASEVVSMQWSKPRGDPDIPRFLFERSQARTFALLGLSSSNDNSAQHVWETTQSLAALTKYTLGGVRSLKQFLEFVGLDVVNKRVVKDTCEDGALAWVAYSDEAFLVPGSHEVDPWVDPGDVWGAAAEKMASSSIPLVRSRDLAFQSLSVYTSTESVDVAAGRDVDPVDAAEAVVSEGAPPVVAVNAYRSQSLSSLSILLWPFRWLDGLVEGALARVVEAEEGGSTRITGSHPYKQHTAHARKVLRVCLVLMPLVFCVLLLALWTVAPDLFPSDLIRMFSSNNHQSNSSPQRRNTSGSNAGSGGGFFSFITSSGNDLKRI